jgi:Zn-dependent M28 family amino/carboxypeptidase
MNDETRLVRGALVALALAMAVVACGRTEAPQTPAAQTEAPAAPKAADPFDPQGQQAADTISGDFLRDVITEISSDKYGGRGPGTEGDVAARKWLAGELEKLGYEPGGADGSWEQPFDLVGVDAKMPRTWTFAKDGKKASFKWWDQYIAASGVQEDKATVKNAEVVFVGYGIEAPEYEWNDFKGQDLKGKILLIMNSDPDWDPALFLGETRLYYGRWTYKYESAARQGAAGAIVIHTTPSAGYPWQVVQTSWSGEQFELPAAGEPRVKVKAWVTEDAARELVGLAGKDLDSLIESAKKKDFTPVPLGITTSINFTSKLNHTQTANVLGLMRGSDPALADDVVVYTAHHDHLGIGEPDANGDKIYNGALDNGAGMAQVMAIAKAFKALPQPPRRSILINFVGAEEQGLLGSKYYAEHSTFPPGRIAANINYDGGDIWGRTRDITYVGKGKSTLDAIVDSIAERQGRAVKPDQFPDRGYFYRSDQFNFAKIGVPALYLHTGTDMIGHEAGWGRAQVEDFEAHRYHQPSDEIAPDWNFDGMVEDARIGFWTGYFVATADQMPSWVPGDEFEAARLKAIAETGR